MSFSLWSRQVSTAFLALLLAGCQPESEAAGHDSSADQAELGAPIPLGRNFDFYVLALSWSPSYCEAEGEDANRQQCAARRPYAFVVHGLWPQYERGFPEHCATAEPAVANERLRTLYDLMPSAGLIRHEWRRHGSCAGLSQDAYFAVLRAARNRIVIPPALAHHDDDFAVDPDAAEQAFVKANDGLSPAGIAVTCDNRYLREVRICLTRELGFRSCPEIDRRACRRDSVVMPPVRGP
jgi:ribonuclease T2